MIITKGLGSWSIITWGYGFIEYIVDIVQRTVIRLISPFSNTIDVNVRIPWKK